MKMVEKLGKPNVLPIHTFINKLTQSTGTLNTTENTPLNKQHGLLDWPTCGHMVMFGGAASSCGRCPLPAGTPSCRARRRCPSSACSGPAWGGRDTASPRATGCSWAPLPWQPFSTASGPLLQPCQREREKGKRG